MKRKLPKRGEVNSRQSGFRSVGSHLNGQTATTRRLDSRSSLCFANGNREQQFDRLEAILAPTVTVRTILR